MVSKSCLLHTYLSSSFETNRISLYFVAFLTEPSNVKFCRRRLELVIEPYYEVDEIIKT